MIDHRLYWIWLQQVFGEGSAMPWFIYNNFPGGLEAFNQAGSRLWDRLSYIKKRHAAALASQTLFEAKHRLDYALQMGWQVVTPECEKYPDHLRNISDPPAVLYIKGRLPDLDKELAVAVVGARKATRDSFDAAKCISYQLASAGTVIVSGGAVGVDQAALEGALTAFGQIICIQPVDLTSQYHSKTEALRRQVLEQGGAVISEFFSARNPGHGSFQVRNRLISGIANGVVLVQVQEKSGSFIYARHAAQQGRDVFVYPGPAGSPAFSGSRILLEEGAIPVTHGKTVLDEYTHRSPLGDPGQNKPAPMWKSIPYPLVREDPEEPLPLLEEEEKIFRALADSGKPRPLPEEPDPLMPEPPLPLEPEEEDGDQGKVLAALREGERTLGQLEAATGLKAGSLMALLTEMELDGSVQSLSGKRYRLAKRR